MSLYVLYPDLLDVLMRISILVSSEILVYLWKTSMEQILPNFRFIRCSFSQSYWM